jgi:hypothetical protein
VVGVGEGAGDVFWLESPLPPEAGAAVLLGEDADESLPGVGAGVFCSDPEADGLAAGSVDVDPSGALSLSE